MSFRDAIANGRGRFKASLMLKLPTEPLESARREMERRFATTRLPQPNQIDIDAIHRKFATIAERDSGWDTISKAEWRIAPFVFSHPSPLLSENDRFRDHYERFLSANRSTRIIKILIHVYLRDFSPTQKGTIWSSSLIRQRLNDPDSNSLGWWRGQQQNLGLFSIEDGPTGVANAVLSSDIPAGRTLSEIGFSGELASGSFVRVAYTAALRTVASRKANSANFTAMLIRLIKWSSTGMPVRHDQWRLGITFEDQRVDLIQALMLPWRTGIQPSHEQKKSILDFFNSHFGDPRINRAHWAGVAEWVVSILLRWLAEGTLEQFFQILDRHAPEEHWRWRRPFWMAFIRRQVVDEAWMVLGPEPMRDAQASFKSGVPAGRLEGAPDKCHSVLLMKIAGLTIAEWSHNGKCRIWLSEQKAPRLYRNRYLRPELIDNDVKIVEHYIDTGIAHHGSEFGTWQGQVAAFIRKRTAVDVRQHEYMN